ARRQVDRAAPLDDRVRRPQQADDLAQSSEALPELTEPLAEPGDRVEELNQVEDIGRDSSFRDRPVPVQRGRDEEDCEQGDRLREGNHREEPDVDERGPPPGVDLGLAPRVVGLERSALPPERLDDANAARPSCQAVNRSAARSPMGWLTPADAWGDVHA